jgi:rod shape-determining protein MreC
VVKGTSNGEVILENVMTDEPVGLGERVVTSGGDQIFPKGVTVGTVMKVSPGADLFLNIRLKPSANLNRLEEVLVITKKEDRAPSVADTGRVRAVDILTQRLPSVPDKPAEPVGGPAANATTPAAGNAPGGSPSGSNSETRAAVKPATVQKAAPVAKKASEPIVKRATNAPASTGPSQADPSQTDPSQVNPSQVKPGASEDQPH